jgi:hypothetical protein
VYARVACILRSNMQHQFYNCNYESNVAALETQILMTNEAFWFPTLRRHASYIHHAPKTHFNIHSILQNNTCGIIHKFTMSGWYVTSLQYSKGNSCRHHMLSTMINRWCSFLFNVATNIMNSSYIKRESRTW